MPEERGSIYKTTANEIGEALKAKLGGEGFAPKDWSDNLNLLGIASEDTEAAINSLKESEGSGERGSILLSTANAIGSMLNKKYNSQRGFSPAEWASATRKMKALETDTKGGGIVNLKGAKEVPLKKCEITLLASLDGYSSVDVHNTGSNLWDESWELGAINIVNGQNVENNNFIRSTNYIPVLPNTVYYKCAPQNILQLYYKKDKTYLSYGSWNKNTTFTTPQDCYFARFYVAQEYGTTYNNDIALNYPSTYTEYAHYSGTIHTASLGRTIYGGSADIVKGEGKDENGNAFTFDPIPINTSGDTENFYTSNGDTSITYYEEPTPYTRGSASGMIASIPEANTEFPFTKLKATIAPSVEGVSSVVVKNEGKNLFDKGNAVVMTGYIGSSYYIEANPQTRTVYIPIRSGTTYTVEKMVTSRFTIATAPNIPSNNEPFTSRQSDHAATHLTITAGAGDRYLWIFFYNGDTDTETIENILATIQVEVGSSASEYTAYKQPTTYTAELGETVYGGSVDLVSGEKVKNYKEITVGNSGWTFYDTGSGTYLYKTVSDKVTPSIGDTSHILVCDILPYGGVNYASQFQDLNVYQANNQNIYIKDNSCTSASDYYTKYANMKIGYELATPTESSIEPQEIYPNEGVNNIWNDANGITEVGYFGE